MCLTETIFFLFCKLSAFTIPQALARQLPLHKGAFFGLCEHCGYVPCPSQGRPLVACKAPSGRGLPRERVGEHARQRTFCKVGKFIRLSHPKSGGLYPKQMLISKLRALPLPLTRHPPPGGGLSHAALLGFNSLEAMPRRPAAPQKPNFVGGHSICPRCEEFEFNNRRGQGALRC